ncbi:MAG: hypothetical protein ABMB14_06690 [Myxococcota bacterium]
MYTALAAAFVRGRRPDAPPLDDEGLVAWGRAEGLRLTKFERLSLPRVRVVLGWLRGLQASTLVDVGSGRGVALWPVLEAFPDVPVTAVDHPPIRIREVSLDKVRGHHLALAHR